MKMDVLIDACEDMKLVFEWVCYMYFLTDEYM